MITYRQARKRIRTAARAGAIREQVRAELARMRAHYEAVAAGTEPGYFGLTPEGAAGLLAAWDDERGPLAPDPEPGHLRAPARPTDYLGRPLPAYMPPGAPRPMSLRETVRALNALGNRVPLWLQLLSACTSPRQVRRTLAALARRATMRLAESRPGYVALIDGEGSALPRVGDQWLEVCLRTGRAEAGGRPAIATPGIAAHGMGAPVIGP